jgi:hypothetical protein
MAEFNQNLNHKFWLILILGPKRVGVELCSALLAAAVTIVVKGGHSGWVAI